MLGSIVREVRKYCLEVWKVFWTTLGSTDIDTKYLRVGWPICSIQYSCKCINELDMHTSIYRFSTTHWRPLSPLPLSIVPREYFLVVNCCQISDEFDFDFDFEFWTITRSYWGTSVMLNVRRLADGTVTVTASLSRLSSFLTRGVDTCWFQSLRRWRMGNHEKKEKMQARGTKRKSEHGSNDGQRAHHTCSCTQASV